MIQRVYITGQPPDPQATGDAYYPTPPELQDATFDQRYVDIPQDPRAPDLQNELAARQYFGDNQRKVLPVGYVESLPDVGPPAIGGQQQISAGTPALNRLTGAGDEPRYPTWPEAMLRSGTSLPGDVYSGAEPVVDPATGHTSGRVIQRAQDTAGLAMTGGLAGAEDGGMVAGSGPVRNTPMPEKMTPGPIWHSPVENAVETSTTNAAPGRQWLATIQNARGVKPEELEWTGLRDFLTARSGEKVTKQELQDRLASNKVQLQDVEKGAAPPTWGELSPDQRQEVANILGENEGYTPDPNSQDVKMFFEQNGPGEFGFAGNSGTKYHDYQLPGGKNYREHLLTLPVDKAARNNYALDTFRQPYDELPPKYQKIIDDDFSKRGADNYRSSHWDEPNIVAHVRTNDRMMEDPAFRVVNRRSNNTSEAFKTREEAEAYQARLPETIRGQTEITDKAIIPKKTLQLVEVQSDWHQAGRKKGYRGDKNQADIDKLNSEYKDAIRESYENGGTGPNQRATDLARQLREAKSRQEHGVPDAPFKDTTAWASLAMKRMIRRAAEEGYDRISWTPGDAQAARYDLSKQVDKVHYNPEMKTIAAYKDGRAVINKSGVEPKDLPDIIGKEAADKIINSPTRKAGSTHEISGMDLKVGGEGMREFYDKILPKVVEKIGKAHGVKVQRGNLPGSGRSLEEIDKDPGWPGGSEYSSRRQEELLKEREFAAANHGQVHYFDIPQSLRDQALQKGMPLFSGGHMFVPAQRREDER